MFTQADIEIAEEEGDSRHAALQAAEQRQRAAAAALQAAQSALDEARREVHMQQVRSTAAVLYSTSIQS